MGEPARREAFRARVRAHLRELGRTQQELARALGLHPNRLSHKLGGTDGAALTQAETKRLVATLAAWQAITTQAEAVELLELAGLRRETFTPGEWAEGPLRGLDPVPTQARPAAFHSPPPAPAAAPAPLPIPPTSFVGRERDITALRELLGQAKLLTLTGTGGAGKTRLALQLATEVRDRWADGVAFVPLADIPDAALVPSVMAQALGLHQEAGDLPALVAHLQDRQLLLLLDNFEHVIPAAEVVERLLASCPALTILVTSRVPLRLYGEHEYRVPPLEVAGGTEGAPAPAVQLFAQRARTALPGFALAAETTPVVEQICAALDGLPLAIELAAARSKLFTPQALLPRLRDRLGLLTGGPRNLPRRQQTLRAALDWSHALLGEEERALFRRLAAFAGCEVESVRAVCEAGAETLDRLVELADQGLLEYVREGEGVRFRMLQTVREYAAARLAESGEEGTVRRRHVAHFLALAEEAAPHLGGPEQAAWLDRLEAEHDNLRAALAWARASGEAEEGLRLAGALWRFWEIRGYIGEGRGWLARALAGDQGTPPARARALEGAGALAYDQGEYGRATALHEEALVLRRELGDQRGVAGALYSLGWVAYAQGNLGRAAALHEETLALRRELGDQQGVVGSLYSLGVVAAARGDLGRAADLYEEALALGRQLGLRERIAPNLHDLGWVAYLQGDLGRAAALLDECLAVLRELGSRRGLALALSNRGLVAQAQGHFERAAALHREGLSLAWEQGDKRWVANGLDGVAGLGADPANPARDPRRAALLLAAAAGLRVAIGAPLYAPEQGPVERAREQALAALGEEGFARAWAEGQALSLEAAVALALAGHDEVLAGE